MFSYSLSCDLLKCFPYFHRQSAKVSGLCVHLIKYSLECYLCYHLRVEVCYVTKPYWHGRTIITGKSVKEVFDRYCQFRCELAKDTLTAVQLRPTLTLLVELLELAIGSSSPSFHLGFNCVHLVNRSRSSSFMWQNQVRGRTRGRSLRTTFNSLS